MKILVLGVLLAVMQATPPVPRHTADKPNSSTQHIKDDASNGKAPAASPSPSPDVAASSPEQNAANNPKTPNAQQPITIRELPPVSVEKDWLDRTAWGFGLVLLIVGILGVWAAVSTLKAINEQAGHMEAQNTKLEQSIALAAETAERQLRAYVLVDSALMKFPETAVPEAQVHFRNSGQTPAYDVHGWIATWFAEYPLKENLPEPSSDFRKGTETLAPGRHSVFLAPRKPPLAPQFLQILGTPQFTLYVYGEIRYRDAFKKDRFTRFRLIHGGTERTGKVRKDEIG